MNKIKYHLLALGPVRYLEWSIGSIYHLIYNGKVPAEDIIITLSDKYKNECPFLVSIIDRMEVQVKWFNDLGHHNKHLEVNKIFKTTDTDIVVQVDCDCWYIGQPELSPIIKETIKDKAFFTFEHGGNAYEVFERMLVLMKLWVTKDQVPDIYIGIFGIEWGEYVEWLKLNKWLHGGLIIYNNPTRLDEWDQMLSLSQLTTCDESVLMAAKYIFDYPDSKSYPDNFCFTSKTKLIHDQSPTRQNFLSKTASPTFIHFSGDWFRLSPKNRDYINEHLNKIIKSI